jgi:cytochrome c biogenesis protein CcmG/thiol:disulfide interchange protein DsbE
MRNLPIIVLLCLISAFAIGLMMPESERKAPPKSGLVGAALPAISLTALEDDTPFTMDQLNGRVTLLNIFASWCAPCELELPEFTALKRMYPNLHVMGIGWHDSPSNIRRWLAHHRAPYDSVWRDPNNSVGVALGMRGVPETFLIDQQGVVRYHMPGPIHTSLRTTILAPLIAELSNE